MISVSNVAFELMSKSHEQRHITKEPIAMYTTLILLFELALYSNIFDKTICM